MSKAVIVGWVISLAGTALWIYGYFAIGNPSLIDWRVIAHLVDCGLLAELRIRDWDGARPFAGMVPIYWPSRR